MYFIELVVNRCNKAKTSKSFSFTIRASMSDSPIWH